MKRKSLIAAVLPVLMVLFALQSCTTKDNSTFTVYNAFTTPVVSAPANGATVKVTGTTVDLKWTSTNKDGDAVLADVYFGTTAVPPLFSPGVHANTLTVTVAVGVTYYWKVTMKDANGVLTYGPTWSFTIYDPIGPFVGTYTVDEPAEGWSYVITTFKGGASALTIGSGKASVTAGATDGWWASWVATFTVDLVANTYSMPRTNFGGGYEGQESGTLNPVNGQMIGNYTIWYKGAVAEAGKHTYTKK